MSDEPSMPPLPVTAEERTRPVFRLLAKAAILLARHHREPLPSPDEPAADDQARGGDHA